MPVTATSERENVLDFDSCDDVIIILKPLVPGLVNPPDVMTAVSGSALVSDHSNQLIVPGIQALTVWSVQDLIS